MIMKPIELIGIAVSPGGYSITTGKSYRIIGEYISDGDLFYVFIDNDGEEAECFAWRFSVNPFEEEIS